MEKEFEKLKELIQDIKVAMMTTIDKDGELRSRPMATTEITEDGVLWFFTYAGSPKTREIEDDGHINISYQNKSDENYASVSGKAVTVKDKNKIEELWTPALNAWFDKGKDDPNIALLRVEVHKAEYWDSPSGLKKTYEMAKSAVSSERFNAGENKKMKF